MPIHFACTVVSIKRHHPLSMQHSNPSSAARRMNTVCNVFTDPAVQPRALCRHGRIHLTAATRPRNFFFLGKFARDGDALIWSFWTMERPVQRSLESQTRGKDKPSVSQTASLVLHCPTVRMGGKTLAICRYELQRSRRG